MSPAWLPAFLSAMFSFSTAVVSLIMIRLAFNITKGAQTAIETQAEPTGMTITTTYDCGHIQAEKTLNFAGTGQCKRCGRERAVISTQAVA